MDYERLLNRVASLDAKIKALSFVATNSSEFKIEEDAKEVRVISKNNPDIAAIFKKELEEHRDINGHSSDY